MSRLMSLGNQQIAPIRSQRGVARDDHQIEGISFKGSPAHGSDLVSISTLPQRRVA